MLNPTPPPAVENPHKTFDSPRTSYRCPLESTKIGSRSFCRLQVLFSIHRCETGVGEGGIREGQLYIYWGEKSVSGPGQFKHVFKGRLFGGGN